MVDLAKIGKSLVPKGYKDDLVSGVFGSEVVLDSLELSEEDVIKDLSYKDLLLEGVSILSLDISKNSSGVAIITPDGYSSESFPVILDDNSLESANFPEVFARRKLKEELASRFEGKYFDYILIEDAYSGENAKTVRLLYSLNTAIDELIWDGAIKCGEFHRIDNGSWKSLLFQLYPSWGIGLNDKVRIEGVLGFLGIKEEGKGFQDRLDALGIGFGFLSKLKGVTRKKNSNTKVTGLQWSNLRFASLPGYISNENLPQFLPKYVSKQGHRVVRLKPGRLLTRKFVFEEYQNTPEGNFLVIEVGITGFDYFLKDVKLQSSDHYLAVWRKEG